ncbi:MAG: transrane protein [Candidatus Magasanikbacteria bacterium]|nr:transrane protein [Candidatus Magasanikbacteria bacterium]
MQLLFFFLIIIPSAILHEYAHGLAANSMGDPTARLAGRLTLNPLAHIDLYGTILMPLFLFLISQGSFVFAYAKPVPYNPYNLKNQQWGSALVGLAGPGANLLVALVFGMIVRVLPLGAFSGLLAIIVYANVLLAVFNLVPIPPLDGSKVLYAFLPPRYDNVKFFLERYGIILLFIFIFFFFEALRPVINWLFQLFVGGGTLPI